MSNLAFSYKAEPSDETALLMAVAMQWLKDAQRDPFELRELADWLGVDPIKLGKAIKGRRFTVSV